MNPHRAPSVACNLCGHGRGLHSVEIGENKNACGLPGCDCERYDCEPYDVHSNPHPLAPGAPVEKVQEALRAALAENRFLKGVAKNVGAAALSGVKSLLRAFAAEKKGPGAG